MGLYDFITQDELDGLPHEDGPRAFSLFVTTAQSKLASLTRGFDPSDAYSRANPCSAPVGLPVEVVSGGSAWKAR